MKTTKYICMEKVTVYNAGHDALVVSLTKFFKKIGISKGDKLFVRIDKDKIILSKNIINPIKPEIISDEVWNSFEGTLVKIYGRDILNDSKHIKKFFEDAIRNWIKKEDKFYKKVILKI
mgnify:CR=1 FL=1